MSLCPTKLFLWQSAIVRDTLQAVEGRPPIEGGYALTFGYPYDYFKLSFESGDPMTSLMLSFLLSSGHKKAGCQSSSGHAYLREVSDVSVSTKRVDKYGHSYFMIRMSPKDGDGPLYCYFPLDQHEDEEKKRIKKNE